MTSLRDMSADELAAQTIQGNRRALARVLSLIEDDHPDSTAVLRNLFPHTGNAYVLGVTGSPGAGKSTLVDRLALELDRQGKKVAVIAVDPTSPFTGGAILGDRIRMAAAADKHQIYIRSMASRGALGGLAPRSADFIFALDAAGFDYILIETVGVGQGEVEVIRHCDTVGVVLVPGMGDGVQAMKAGILEIADVFVINKADYDGVDRLERELLAMFMLSPDTAQRHPEIVRTVASEGRGIEAVIDAVTRHAAWAQSSGASVQRRKKFFREALFREVGQLLIADFSRSSPDVSVTRSLDSLIARKDSPREVAKQLVEEFYASKKNEA